MFQFPKSSRFTQSCILLFPVKIFDFYVIFLFVLYFFHVLNFFLTTLGESNKCKFRFCNECQHELQTAASWILVPYLMWVKKVTFLWTCACDEEIIHSYTILVSNFSCTNHSKGERHVDNDTDYGSYLRRWLLNWSGSNWCL